METDAKKPVNGFLVAIQNHPIPPKAAQGTVKIVEAMGINGMTASLTNHAMVA